MPRLACFGLLGLLLSLSNCHALPRALLQNAAPAPQASPTGGGGATLFMLAYGGYDNYFYSDDTVAGVVLLTQPGVRLPDGDGVRLLIAFPDANSGAVAYFNATEGPSSDLMVELVNGTLTSTEGPDGSVGLTGTLVFDRNATLYRALVGSVRTIRDYVEGPRIVRDIFAHNSTQEGDAVVLYREYINGTGSNTLSFAPADDSAILELTPDGNFTITLAPGATDARVDFTALVEWPNNLVSFKPPELLAPDQQGIADTPQVTQLSFLTSPQKFLAGSWRFLTYFGRDSLIAVRLMMRRLSSPAIEAALGAALSNLNTLDNYYQYSGQDLIPVGTVCHEETLGDYASYVNIQEGTPERGGKLWCDYKMIDTDFLLLPSVAEYFLNTPQGNGTAPDFLATAVPSQGGTALNANATFAQLLEDNAELVLDLARPFAANRTVDNLIALRPGQPVGNWRDSNTGLANARIPFDVNTALVPAALRAVQQLSAAGILDSEYEAEADQLATVWETETAPLFEISLSAARAEELASSYANQLGVAAPNATANVLDTPDGNVTFYALALYDDGTPVPIMHSDLGFNLLYETNVPEGIIRSLPLLLSEFPLGLLTPAGMVVANPAYAQLANDAQLTQQLYSNFTNGFYHGSVIWGFQQALMVEGLRRQLQLCQAPSAPAWCSDQQLIGELEAAGERLWSVITSNPHEAFSEVWSWRFENGAYRVASLAENSAQSTEGNAIQLWSYGFIAAQDPVGNQTLLDIIG